MNYVVTILALVVFLMIKSFGDIDVQYYNMQEKFYSYMKLYDFNVINGLTNYSTCERTTKEGTTRLGYCLFSGQKRELFIPNFENREQTYTVIRTCNSCKNQISDKGLLYYPNGSILGCQYGVEGVVIPLVMGISNNDIYKVTFDSINQLGVVGNKITIAITVGATPSLAISSTTPPPGNVTTAVVAGGTATYTGLTEESIIRNILNGICGGGAVGKCMSSTNSDLNKFYFYISDDNKSLYIGLKDKNIQLNSLGTEVVDGVPFQNSSGYQLKKVLNKCGI